MTKLSSEKLRSAINICNRFVQLKPTLPVLGNIKIESHKTKLVLTATNLESSIILELPSSGEEWETTVPAKLSIEFLNLIKAPEVILETEKEQLIIASGESKGRFNTISTQEFPKVTKVREDSVVISQKDLQNAVSSIAFAASADEGKPVLNGILVRNKDDKTLLVATDSYRLAQYFLSEKQVLQDLIVPARAFADAVKIAGELEEENINLYASGGNNQLIISGESFQISTRLIDGVYPTYEQIIPTKFVTEISVDRAELIQAIKQAAVFARDVGNVVKLLLKPTGRIFVNASTRQVGEGSSEVRAQVKGEELEVAINSSYLLAGLDNLNGDKADIKFSGSFKPAIIYGVNPETFSYVVMPVKPQN